MVLNRAVALVSLARPLEWSKSLNNMLIAALYASFIVLALGEIFFEKLELFALAFIVVGPMLWGGLYALNDYTDRHKDRLHHAKRHRPLASEKLSPKLALAFALLLIFSSLLLGFFVGWLFFLCLVAMLVNQLLYTHPSIHLKKRKGWDLVSGSLVNPFFRFYAGWVLFVPAFNAPVLLLLFVLGIQFAGFTLYRLSAKDHEKELEFRSSAVEFGERNLRHLAYVVGGIGGLGFLLMVLIPVFVPSLKFLGWLPLRFAWIIVFSALLAPLYCRAARDPKNMDLKKMHKTIYWHNIAFIVLFAALFILF